ncbi:MAG: YlxM family DNA-binding protein [Candidatus Coprovivens sp.]
MENFIYYNSLFDIYSDLLTDKEKENFSDYYQEDLSLAEIAENKNISRSAVQKTIKNVIQKLDNYESKLHIYENNCKLRDVSKSNDINEIKEVIEKVLF